VGNSLIHDPERAPLVLRAFEEYATGRFTKEQLLKQTTTWGLTNRRGKPLTSQAIGVLLRNQIYAGIVDVPEYGVRGKRGDFDPVISEELFYRSRSGRQFVVLATGSGPDAGMGDVVRTEGGSGTACRTSLPSACRTRVPTYDMETTSRYGTGRRKRTARW
jgi:hypothetical protein